MILYESIVYYIIVYKHTEQATCIRPPNGSCKLIFHSVYQQRFSYTLECLANILIRFNLRNSIDKVKLGLK